MELARIIIIFLLLAAGILYLIFLHWHSQKRIKEMQREKQEKQERLAVLSEISNYFKNRTIALIFGHPDEIIDLESKKKPATPYECALCTQAIHPHSNLPSNGFILDVAKVEYPIEEIDGKYQQNFTKPTVWFKPKNNAVIHDFIVKDIQKQNDVQIVIMEHAVLGTIRLKDPSIYHKDDHVMLYQFVKETTTGYQVLFF